MVLPLAESKDGRSGLTLSKKSSPPSPADWERHRSTIQNLYMRKNRTLADVQGILSSNHGFVASYAHLVGLQKLCYCTNYSRAKQWKTQFLKWGWRKYKRGQLKVTALSQKKMARRIQLSSEKIDRHNKCSSLPLDGTYTRPNCSSPFLDVGDGIY